MMLKQFLPFLLVVAWSQANAFQPVPHFDDRWMGFSAHGEYFSTSGNLSADGGVYDSLGSGYSFETLSLRLAADYMLKPKWRLTGGGLAIYATSDDPFQTRTTTELNHLFLESLHLLSWKDFILAPQIRFVGTLKEVDPRADDVIAGEGTHQIEFGSWGSVSFGPFDSYVYGGYRIQNDGRAHLFPYQVGLRYNYRNLYLLGEIYGHFPMSEDEYKDRPNLRFGPLSQVNARSLRYYSIDPTLMEGRGEIGYDVTSQMTVYAGGSQTIDGKNAAYGFAIHLGVQYSLDRLQTAKPKRQRGFRPIMDDYDESLFTPTNED